MSERPGSGCPEYRTLSRRGFLAGAAATAGLAGLPAWLPRVAFAQDGAAGRDVLLSIFLRGGADGLTLCVPYGESAYYAARPALAVPRPDSAAPDRALDLNGFFGFPPALAPLLEAYRAGHLLVVHATGSHDPSRSHFDAQRFMEVGSHSHPGLYTGWLGRHLAGVPAAKAGALLRALGTDPGLQRVLQGGPKTLPIPDPSSFTLAGNSTTRAARAAWLARVYGAVAAPFPAAARDTLNTVSLLERLGISAYVPGGGAVYPESTFGQALRASAALIKAEVGIEAIQVDLPGWDTHNQQGSTAGALAALMTDFAGSLAAFYRDLFSGTNRRVTVLAISEFGRCVHQNGSEGSDHGHGNALFLLGEAIQGGQVLTTWPGLEHEQLYQGEDLQVTIDYRDILAEVLVRRLGCPSLARVFPGYTPTFRGVVRA